ncbi:MAG: mechanosensitive ion channel family protein [Leptolyngbya sp. DLM2.Bin27]|nr:MAG: mechanosensitive ion channel family protein [Leptolyngbya sp. DLM2.Bin27]
MLRSHIITAKGIPSGVWSRLLLPLVAGLIGLGIALGGLPGLAQSPAEPPTLAEVESPAAVTLGDQTLFTIQSPQIASSPEARARRISDRLTATANNQSIPVEAIALSDTEFGTAIYAEDSLIMVVDDEDVVGTGLTPRTMATQHLAVIQREMQRYREERRADYLSRAAAIALVCTLGLGLAILVLANVMPQFYRWLDRQQDRWMPNLRIQTVELLTAAQLTILVQVITKVLHFVLVLALVLFYLSFVLSLFPQTRALGQGVWGHFGGAVGAVWNGFIGYLPNLFSIAIIVTIAASLLRLARWLSANIRRGRLNIAGFYPEWALPTYRLVQFLLVAITFALVFPYLPGAESPAFQGVSIFFGLLVSLGAGGVILSIVAGFILVYTRAFRAGDRIKFGDIEGFVEEKSLFVTRLRTLENVLVSVPNAALLTGNIANYSALIREQQIPIIVTTTVTLGYDLPWPLVHTTLIAAAAATAHILKEPRPEVWQTALDDFYVSYQLRAATMQPQMLEKIYSELHQNLQDHCNRAGIEIMSPHYRALRDGSQSTQPASYLPETYQPPGWNFSPGWPSAGDAAPPQNTDTP